MWMKSNEDLNTVAAEDYRLWTPMHNTDNGADAWGVVTQGDGGGDSGRVSEVR